MKTEIFNSYSEFLNRENKDANGVSVEFAKQYPNYQKDNETNKRCWDCRGCSDCSYCIDCSGCSGCLDCSYCIDCSGCRGCSDCSYCIDCSGCSGCRGCIYCSDCRGCSDCSGCSGCLDCSYCIDCSGCRGCINCSYCSYCIDCSGCSGCRGCSYCIDCSYCSDCSGCSYCSYCIDCSGCRGCIYCSDCRGCSDCSDLENNAPKKMASIPIIKNIHQKIAEAIESNKLNMDKWHEDESINNEGAYCGTTHCRAGWVIALAGKEGVLLESETDTCFAAMMIYKASSDIRVSPTRFFETNEVAMADIIRCAELEKIEIEKL